MARTLLTLVFVAAVGSAGAAVARIPTVARGHVFAAEILERGRAQGLTEVRCDDAIPVGLAGATFRCHLSARDGTRAQLDLVLDRSGSYKATASRPLGASAPAAPAAPVRRPEDAWSR